MDTRRGGSIDPRSGSHARTRVTNLPESTGKLWHPFLSACFYALLALEEPFSRERLWKVLSIDFDAFLPRHPRNDFKWNSEAVCTFSFLDWSGEKRSSVIPFLCAWLFGKRNILDGNGLLLRAENLPTRRAGHLNGGILIEGDTHIAGDDRVDRKIGRPSLPALRSWGFSASLARGPTQKLGRGLVVVRSGASERPGLRRILRSPVHIAGTPITKHCV